MWWTAQSVWSAIMASSRSAGIFTVSGNRKRNVDEISSNKVKLFGTSDLIDSREEAMQLLQGAAVLHFAGRGKAWIGLAQELGDDTQPPHVLRVLPSRPAAARQRFLLAARILAVQIKDLIGEMARHRSSGTSLRGSSDDS
jgi:hypothetical protein